MIVCCISFDSYIKPQPRYAEWKTARGCISFDSYIKPQLTLTYSDEFVVVYLLIPTSNHNQTSVSATYGFVVYLLIPTSNHNWDVVGEFFFVLYIF